MAVFMSWRTRMMACRGGWGGWVVKCGQAGQLFSMKRQIEGIECASRDFGKYSHACTMRGASSPLIAQTASQLMLPRTNDPAKEAAPSVVGVVVSLIVLGRDAKRGL